MNTRRMVLLGALGAVPALALRPARAAGTPITIAVSSNSLAYGGLRIAQAAGLFQRHGIEPRIVVTNSGNAAVSALVSGSAEFSAAGPSEVLAAKVRGRSLVIVLNFYRGLSGSLVLSKAAAAKAGVAADTPVEQRLRALDGLQIAVPSATSAYLHPFRAGTDAVGAKPKFLYMTQPAMVAALQAGAIDGMVGAAPFSLTAATNGSGTLWISGPREDLPEALRPASSACLQTTLDYAKAHPDLIQAMRQVGTDMAALIRDRPAEAEAFLDKAYTNLDTASAKAAFEESAANWSRPVMTVDDIKREISIQASSGALPGVEAIDPASVLAPGG